MGKLLAQTMLGEEPELPLFDPARLVVPVEALAQPHREKTE
jgi:sarcosine oxidase subunit beta